MTPDGFWIIRAVSSTVHSGSELRLSLFRLRARRFGGEPGSGERVVSGFRPRQGFGGPP